ncbi:high frequency lysogenization protein HflD [Gilvimarinus xylanilyticus]|uniref:High frequency lysogenization protein HflD homolog n=1 Tax=Gilvimarinus xylanilyticus TaxID=2944139 RepID=A0A9X2HW90_9GAMM|nr:high frequency lysogenization protein HflD [Gilvimarinus xylanilyticus]MCP8898164.1 high frequency lysogenization protein HflD [Gilvimarinus xylanilyticus]
MARANKWQDITLAAAGILQATALVDQLARTGFTPSDAYRCSINSLFQLNPPDTLSVYGSVADLRLGLETLRDLLMSSRQLQNNTVRYSAGVLHLQGRLSKRKDMLGVIASRLQQAQQQAEHFDTTHENVIANLADIYASTLSRFRFRIQVAGDPSFLQQQRVANQVRALLLAAIRSATLWRQVGGSRLQILLQRKKLLAETEHLLRQIPV